MKTQAERVLEAAESFQGTCQADWLADVTPDGGPRITRVAARLHELDGRGYGFECIGWRSRTKVFRLCSEPDVGRADDDQPDAVSPAGVGSPPVVGSASADTRQPSLFDEAPAPRNGHYDDVAA